MKAGGSSANRARCISTETGHLPTELKPALLANRRAEH